MSDDILKRLNTWHYHMAENPEYKCLLCEAHDTIEQLREDVQGLLNREAELLAYIKKLTEELESIHDR